MKPTRKRLRKDKTRSEARHKGKFKDDHHLKDFRLTNHQRECLSVVEQNKITFIDSVSGVGKSSSALYYACNEYLKDPSKEIVIVRSPVEMGRDSIGFLQGGYAEKIEPTFASARIFTRGVFRER